MIIDTTKAECEIQMEEVPLYLYIVDGEAILSAQAPVVINEGDITPHEACTLAEALLERAKKVLRNSRRGER